MHDTHPRRPSRSPQARLLAAATLVSAVLVAGCGGSSGGQSTAATTVSAATPVARTTTAAHAVATHRHATGSNRPGSYGSGPLALAKCMRADGVPDFPDPGPNGNFSLGSTFNPASPTFRAAQSKCQKLMDAGAVGGPLVPGATTHPSPQTLEKLVRIAQCMRRHGISQFPDPRTSIPSNAGPGIQEITNFDGVILLFPTTLNLQEPAYRQDLTACGAPPLGLPH